jgi:hypothetical protein
MKNIEHKLRMLEEHNITEGHSISKKKSILQI